MQIFDIHFLQNYFLYLIFILPFLLYFFIKKEKNNTVNIKLKQDEKRALLNSLFYFKIFLISLISIIFILILSDPHKLNIKEKINKNWIDIVLVLDISKSMEAVDLSPTRIEKSKQVLENFISSQKTNRLWLVIFSWAPFLWIPLTFDYDILKQSIKNLTTDALSWNTRVLDWTAIWDSLLLSKSLFENDWKNLEREKAIIILTDWDANKGADPVLVSKLLKDENIKIYSVWIWGKDWSYIERNNWFFSQKIPIPPLNSSSLKEISKNTGWYYFNWSDDEAMENIFEKLEELEKNDIEVEIDKSFREYYTPFVYFVLFFVWLLLFVNIRRVKI